MVWITQQLGNNSVTEMPEVVVRTKVVSAHLLFAEFSRITSVERKVFERMYR